MDWNELLEIIDDEEDNYNWGGGEDENGSLSKGYVNFDKIKEAINKLRGNDDM